MISAGLRGTKETYKNQLHFYLLTTNMWKLKCKTIPFTITPKKMKYLGINLTKHIQDLHAENYKMLLQEIRKSK